MNGEYQTKIDKVFYSMPIGLEITAVDIASTLKTDISLARTCLSKLNARGDIDKVHLGKYVRTKKERELSPLKPKVPQNTGWLELYSKLPDKFGFADVLKLCKTKGEAYSRLKAARANGFVVAERMIAVPGKGRAIIYKKANKETENKVKQEGLLQTIVAEFTALTNAEKAALVARLLPNIDQKDLLEWYNISYPVPKKFDNVLEGDELFHPMLDNVVIVKTFPEWLCFYGNGAEWKVDREGYIDGKKDKPPVLFFDLDDYVAWKKAAKNKETK